MCGNASDDVTHYKFADSPETKKLNILRSKHHFFYKQKNDTLMATP